MKPHGLTGRVNNPNGAPKGKRGPYKDPTIKLQLSRHVDKRIHKIVKKRLADLMDTVIEEEVYLLNERLKKDLPEGSE
jgi:hypothetical protein